MSEECISVGNSLLLERVLSQWTYVIKGKAGFKGSTVEDGPIADGAPGRIRFVGFWLAHRSSRIAHFEPS